MPLVKGYAPIFRRYSSDAMIMPVVVRPRPIYKQSTRRIAFILKCPVLSATGAGSTCACASRT
eukprot:1138848-Pelagomonas_calceolata.AAC.6